MALNHHYSVRSLKRLAGVDDRLVRVCIRALQIFGDDITIIQGRRTIAEQKELVENGDSWTMNSLHLTGKAVDVAPLINGSIPWGTWPVWEAMAGSFFKSAKELNVEIEWGGNWKQKDGPHFELKR